MVFIQEIKLRKTKDKAYVINLEEYKSIGTHWMALYVNDDNGIASFDATYFDSFGVEHIPKEIKKFIGNKNINIYRIQAFDSIICGYFCWKLNVCDIIQIYFLLTNINRIVKKYQNTFNN